MGFQVVEVGPAAVNLHAQVVPQPVRERLAQSRLLNNRACGAVHLPALKLLAPILSGLAQPFLHQPQPGVPRPGHRFPGVQVCLTRFTREAHPGHVAKRPARLLRPEVDQHALAWLQHRVVRARRLVVWVSGVSREAHIDRVPGAHARRLDAFHDQRLHLQLAHRLARLQPFVDQLIGGVFGVHQHRHGPLVRLKVAPLPDGEALQQIGAGAGFQARSPQPFQRARVHPAHIRHCAIRAVLQCAAFAV